MHMFQRLSGIFSLQKVLRLPISGQVGCLFFFGFSSSIFNISGKQCKNISGAKTSGSRPTANIIQLLFIIPAQGLQGYIWKLLQPYLENFSSPKLLPHQIWTMWPTMLEYNSDWWLLFLFYYIMILHMMQWVSIHFRGTAFIWLQVNYLKIQPP